MALEAVVFENRQDFLIKKGLRALGGGVGGEGCSPGLLGGDERGEQAEGKDAPKQQIWRSREAALRSGFEGVHNPKGRTFLRSGPGFPERSDPLDIMRLGKRFGYRGLGGSGLGMRVRKGGWGAGFF